MTKEEKIFEAVLAKNRIAREIAEHKRHGSPITSETILEDLKAIEAAIGTMNQPTVEDIFNNNSKVDRSFTI